MKSRFTVACKCEHVRAYAFCLHLRQFFVESFRYLLPSRQRTEGASFLVESAFAINAVERTAFTVARQKINTQRYA
jgi:hypothetical protein